MLDHGASIVAILTFLGAVGGILFKLVRWGIRQDIAIAELQRKTDDMERRLQEGEWAGQVFVLPRGEQRQRARGHRGRRRLMDASDEPED